MPIPHSPRAVVTGAGSGLGRAFCIRLARRGARILAADIHLDAARETVALLAAHAPGGACDAHAAHADVSRIDDVRALHAEADRLFGGTDLLINNAGVAVSYPIGSTPIEDWQWIVGVNLMGVVYGCEVFVPGLRRQGSGHVINVASAAGLLSPPLLGPYNATKSAVVALSETLFGELRGTGAGCTVLCPTFFPTNIGKNARSADGRATLHVEKLMQRSRLSAEDVAEFALVAAEHDRLYALPHADGRWFWRLKRAAPTLFFSNVRRVLERQLRRMGG